MMQDITSRGESRGRSYGKASSYQLADRSHVGRNTGTRTEIKAQASVYNRGMADVKGDDQSDTSILRDVKEDSNITQTREVTIAYSECGDDASNDGRVRKLA